MKKTFIGILLSLLLTFVSGQAMASSASATATLSWSLATGAISWTAGDPINNYETSATDTVYGTAIPVFGVNIETSTLPNASAIGQGTNNLSATTSIDPAAVVPGKTQAEARADAVGTFTATGNGYVTFNIPWTLAYSLTTDTGTSSYSHGIATIAAYLTRYAVNGKVIEQTVVQYISDTNDFPGTLSNSKANATETLRSMFLAGEKGTINFIARTEVDAASVPIPAGLWLLGSGLLGLVGIRRKSLK